MICWFAGCFAVTEPLPFVIYFLAHNPLPVAPAPAIGEVAAALKDKLSDVQVEHGVPTSGSHSDEEAPYSSWIGASLVLGFIFMLLVDQISSRLSGGKLSAN